MDGSNLTPGGVLALTGYGLTGLVGTIVGTVVLLFALQPAQPVVYDALYRQLGPWTATSAATAVQFGAAGLLAVSLPALAAEHLDGGQTESAAAVLAAGVFVLVAALVVAVALGAPPLPATAAADALFVAAAFVALGRVGVSQAGRTTFVAGAPALALLLVLLAVGLGWGGGYDVVAEPVPASDVGDELTSFDDAPQLRADLFTEQGCDPADDGVCRLSLRGYEHEVAAARFLDDHGVRCPFVNDPTNPVYDRDASFVAEHGDDYYRLSCEAYGD